ncbi:hypothetical protein V495_02933 [Pseudogymnoascus sp. VKM F-4514 (FW-929)]|nr:hypothetical protein V495_02933 [Pseudogymnoascus sp. VKM F-4514 (FW-929)]KFY61168.1 hypothetical protein V497_03114 [Pseudogymnoascus sp. VKM F-4516 (FW-969)]
MSAGLYYTNLPPKDDYLYVVGDDSQSGFYDGKSMESTMASAALPQVSSNSNSNISASSLSILDHSTFTTNGCLLTLLQDQEEMKHIAQYGQSQPYIYQCQMPDMYYASHLAATIELKIEDLHENIELPLKQPFAAKPASSQVLSRRRAQNRASQRAFRNRKEKHVNEVEARLQELEGKYQELLRSYESLQTEYVIAKQQLEMLNAEERLQAQPESEPESESEPEQEYSRHDSFLSSDACTAEMHSIIFAEDVLCIL